MMQVMTIREQIEKALKRVKSTHSIGYDIRTIHACRDELHCEFDETATAFVFDDNFDEIVAKMGYVKRDPDKVCISREAAENWLYHLRELHSIEKIDEKRYAFHHVADAWIHSELTAALEVNRG